MEDVSVVTWGSPGGGGDSSAVSGQLRNVQQVQGTSSAFAAILADGSVVTWGHPFHGGDSSRVKDQLRKFSPRIFWTKRFRSPTLEDFSSSSLFRLFPLGGPTVT